MVYFAQNRPRLAFGVGQERTLNQGPIVVEIKLAEPTY